MTSPNITGNPTPIDKDVLSGIDEGAGSVPFLSSLLSLISSLNPNRRQRTDTQRPEFVFCLLPVCLLSSASLSSVFKFDASTEIQNPISMIEKEIVEFSSLNIVQPYHSPEKGSPYTLSETRGFLPTEFPLRNEKVATSSPLHQFTPSPIITTALMGKDLASVSMQEVKGLNVDDKTVPSTDEDRESVIFEEVNRDLTGFHVSKKFVEPDPHDSLKTFKDSFEGEFKITMAEVSTDHRNKNGVHQQKDVPDSSLALRQIDLPSNIVSADNTNPIQDKQSLEISKAIIAHLDMEHSHDPDLSTIKVTVQHDRLGELDIKLILNKGVINGQIKTPEVTTADLIVRNIPEIINSLIKDGLNVGNLFVSLRNSRSGRDNFDYRNSGGSGEISRRQTNNLSLMPSESGYINIFV